MHVENLQLQMADVKSKIQLCDELLKVSAQFHKSATETSGKPSTDTLKD